MTASSLTHRIVVPLDGSDVATIAIPYLRAVATSASAVVLLRVLQWQLPLPGIATGLEMINEDLVTPPLARATAYLKAVADELGTITGDIRSIARPGEAVADEILHVVKESDATLIIMATRGRGALGRALIGSVADLVARASTVPGLLIHPDQEGSPAEFHSTATIQRLVVPLDGSERARAALSVAAGLASKLGLPVHLLRAVPLRNLTDQERAYYESSTAAAEEQLAQAAGRLRSNGTETTTELVVGMPAPAIMATMGSGDLIVMMSRGASGIRRWQLGSVAEKLIHQAAGPILLVPDTERSRSGVRNRDPDALGD